MIVNLKENTLLSQYTTFKIGGRAKYFFKAKNEKELIEAINFAKKNKLPFFVIGDGSNLLISDKGFNGLVIKIQSSGLKIKNKNKKSKIIFAQAGVKLSQVLDLSLKNNLTGLEWAVGIPGTIGGAIYGNAGAFGRSISDIVKSVEVLDIASSKPKIKKMKNKDCNFGYRNSIFKKNKNLIIISAELQLKKGDKKNIEGQIKKNLEYKKKTQPLNFFSAGSVFKNPPQKSAGELIEKCGLKGKKAGKIKISEKHANFIVNLGGGKAKDVKKLINLIKKEVKNKFKISLEEEIQYLG